MQLRPRYDGPAVIDLDDVAENPSAAVLRQRSRLAAVLVGLSDEEWAAPSRCRGWSVQDVIEHLVGVNRYWAHSVEEGLKGTPTRLLTDFDPVSVPASMVDAARGRPPSATLDAFASTNDRLTELWSSLDEAEWSTVAEAPPGHLALRAVAVHALWDSWIHERDVLLPLSRVQQVEADEVELTLAYAAAIGPAFRITATADARTGTLAVIAHHPEITLHVDQDEVVRVRRGLLRSSAPTVEGDAVRLAEGFSRRGPQPAITDEDRWLIAGLEEAFDDGPAQPASATASDHR